MFAHQQQDKFAFSGTKLVARETGEKLGKACTQGRVDNPHKSLTRKRKRENELAQVARASYIRESSVYTSIGSAARDADEARVCVQLIR